MMLVVVFLLLPVIMSGASLELPGAGCHAGNCCVVAACHAHEAEDEPAAHDHHHHRHAHERILLLSDAGMRDAAPTVAAFAAQTEKPVMYGKLLVEQVRCSLPLLAAPPPYLGYLVPQRC